MRNRPAPVLVLALLCCGTAAAAGPQRAADLSVSWNSDGIATLSWSADPHSSRCDGATCMGAADDFNQLDELSGRGTCCPPQNAQHYVNITQTHDLPVGARIVMTVGWNDVGGTLPSIRLYDTTTGGEICTLTGDEAGHASFANGTAPESAAACKITSVASVAKNVGYGIADIVKLEFTPQHAGVNLGLLMGAYATGSPSYPNYYKSDTVAQAVGCNGAYLHTPETIADDEVAEWSYGTCSFSGIPIVAQLAYAQLVNDATAYDLYADASSHEATTPMSASGYGLLLSGTTSTSLVGAPSGNYRAVATNAGGESNVSPDVRVVPSPSAPTDLRIVTSSPFMTHIRWNGTLGAAPDPVTGLPVDPEGAYRWEVYATAFDENGTAIYSDGPNPAYGGDQGRSGEGDYLLPTYWQAYTPCPGHVEFGVYAINDNRSPIAKVNQTCWPRAYHTELLHDYPVSVHDDGTLTTVSWTYTASLPTPAPAAQYANNTFVSWEIVAQTVPRDDPVNWTWTLDKYAGVDSLLQHPTLRTYTFQDTDLPTGGDYYLWVMADQHVGSEGYSAYQDDAGLSCVVHVVQNEGSNAACDSSQTTYWGDQETLAGGDSGGSTGGPAPHGNPSGASPGAFTGPGTGAGFIAAHAFDALAWGIGLVLTMIFLAIVLAKVTG